MKKLKINSLDDLEQIVLNEKISKLDRYRIFSQALKSYPIVFIEIITDSSELQNGIEDKRELLIPQMRKIISELRENPTATHYSGMSVIRNEADNEALPDAIIDFSD